MAEALAAMGAMEQGQSTYQEFWNSLPEPAKKISQTNGLQTTLSFSALQLLPELQHHSIRLQILSSLSFLFCEGKNRLKTTAFNKVFKMAGRSIAATLEDPPEDAFCSSVCTTRGQFLLLEATDEGAGFFSQRLINVVEGMPENDQFEKNIKGPVFALLKLSDTVLKRAGLVRNMEGSRSKSEELDSATLDKLADFKKALSFSNNELRELGISKELLEPFNCGSLDKKQFKRETFGSTSLNFFPVGVRSNGVDLLFPSLVSTALRGFIIQTIQSFLPKALMPALAFEYEKLIAASPYGPSSLGHQSGFQKVKGVWVLNLTRQLDTGRYLHMFYFLDELADFAPEFFGGMGANDGLSDAIEYCTNHTAKEISKDPDFIEGLTLVVGCGVGRGVMQGIPYPPKAINWKIEALPIHDLETAYWHPNHNDRMFWQAIQNSDAVAEFGVELFNVNGLLNLIAWQNNLHGHMVPHADIPTDFVPSKDARLLLPIPTNELLDLRLESHAARDQCTLVDWEGNYRTVVVSDRSRFGSLPVYGELKFDRQYPLVVVPDERCNLWASVSCPKEADRRFGIERLKMITAWLPRISKAMATYGILAKLPTSVYLEFDFDTAIGIADSEVTTLDAQNSLDFSRADFSDGSDCISFKITSDFDTALHHPKNIAERRLLSDILDAVKRKYSLDIDKDQLLAKIVKNDFARYAHAFRVTSFRHHFHYRLPSKYVVPNDVDGATQRLMMGWEYGAELAQRETTGVAECCRLLNKIIAGLEGKLIAKVRTFDPTEFLEKILVNHEAAWVSRESWKRSTAAILGLAENESEAREDILRQSSKTTTAFVGYRVLMEVGQVECGKDDVLPLGDFDLADLMATVLEIFQLGNASDAIHYGAMEPLVRISPLGDVMMNWDFHEGTVNDVVTQNFQDGITFQTGRYAKYFEEAEVSGDGEDQPESEFTHAFSEEVGCRLKDLTDFLSTIQNILLEMDQPYWNCCPEELKGAVFSKAPDLEDHFDFIFNAMTMPPRENWNEIPEGFLEKDKQPWRFRRMLSVLRRPILSYRKAGKERLIVCGGMIQDGILYMLDRYLEGDFDQHQLSSRKMKQWFGKVASENQAFNETVCDNLRTIGLEAVSDKNLQELINGSSDTLVDGIVASGDVDALAWNAVKGIVYAFECKKLQGKKTAGELAEQLSKYSGNGQKDKLRKHLARLTVLQRHTITLSSYFGFEVKKIVGGLVFSERVPMHYDDGVRHLTPVLLLEDMTRETVQQITPC